MKKQNVIIAVLVLFVLIGAMQSVQLANIQNRLSGYAAAGPIQQPQISGVKSQQLPPNLQQLPQQIGGC